MYERRKRRRFHSLKKSTNQCQIKWLDTLTLIDASENCCSSSSQVFENQCYKLPENKMLNKNVLDTFNIFKFFYFDAFKHLSIFLKQRSTSAADQHSTIDEFNVDLDKKSKRRSCLENKNYCLLQNKIYSSQNSIVIDNYNYNRVPLQQKSRCTIYFPAIFNFFLIFLFILITNAVSITGIIIFI